MRFDVRSLRWMASAACLCGVVGVFSPTAAILAQVGGAAAVSGDPKPVANPGDQIVIKREALQLIDPQRYRINFSIAPRQRVELIAPADGVIKAVAQKPGDRTVAQTEILRLDNTRAKLLLDRAKAVYRAETLAVKGATGESGKEIADARLDAAKADLDLAQLVFDQTSVRAPFDGEIERILVSPGEYVREGQPVAILFDPAQMVLEVPLERAAAEPGKACSIKIEGSDVGGKVEAVLPLNARFDNLRDLFETVTSAMVVFDNSSGKLKSGMTAYPPIVPRQNVVEVPAASISNTTDGGRKVQVVRLNVIRDIPVSLLAPIGTGRLFVSGPFLAGDEVVYHSSHELGDGFQIQPSALAPAAAGQATPAGQTPKAPASGVGF